MDDLRSKIKIEECLVHLQIEDQYPNEIRGNFQCLIKNESDNRLALNFTINLRGYNSELDISGNTIDCEIESHDELSVAFGHINLGSAVTLVLFDRVKPRIDFIINEVSINDDINLEDWNLGELV